MDAFLQACGVSPALELEVEVAGPASVIRYCLRQPFVILGRHPLADIRLDADGVRPRHLYFQAIEGRVACINVAHSASFVADDHEIVSFSWLPIGQSVEIGTRRIRLLSYESTADLDSGLSDPFTVGSAFDIFAPRMTLELMNEEIPGERQSWPIDRLVTLVGRTSRCDIQLNHEMVSNVHCSLVLTAAGLWVVDLLGRDGILINERPVRAGCLGMEDELRIGPYRLRLQEIPIPRVYPKDENDYHPLTPISEFDFGIFNHPDSNHELAEYSRSWSEEGERKQLLEELMDQFQNMQGSMFDQHQDTLSRMIEAFQQTQENQTLALKKELEQLRSITREVEALQKGVETPGVDKEVGTSNSAQPILRLDPGTNESTKPVRSATSLLHDADMSVFRIPMKTME